MADYASTLQGGTWEKGDKVNNLKVSCYSGHTYAERPQSFQMEGGNYEVKEIERTWLEPGKRYFQVRTSDNKIFRLCYDEIEGQWSVVEFVP